MSGGKIGLLIWGAILIGSLFMGDDGRCLLCSVVLGWVIPLIGHLCE